MRIQTSSPVFLRLGRCLLTLALSLLLSACKSEFNVDLSTANFEEARSVEVKITGVELLDEQDGVVSIDVEDAATVDLLDYQGGAKLRLVADEEIPARTYRGMRLVFDTADGKLTRADGTTAPIRPDGDRRYATLALSLSDDDAKTIQGVLDLRFSLADRSDSASGVFFLQPELRAGVDDELGTLVGTVDADFVRSRECAGVTDGYAMYLYTGEARVPVDFLSGASDNPLASASLTRVSGDADYTYAFQGLPEDRYTLVFTCQADLDDPLERSVTGLVFIGSTSVRVEEGKETREDF